MSMTISEAAKKWSEQLGRKITYHRVTEWIKEGRVRSARVPQLHGEAIIVLDTDPPGPSAKPIPSQKGRARRRPTDEAAVSPEVEVADSVDVEVDAGDAVPAAADEVVEAVAGLPSCSVCEQPLGPGADVVEFEGDEGETLAAHADCLD